MCQIIDRVETTNEYGQLTVRGRVVLTEDTEMLNVANRGKEPWACVQPLNVVVPAGTHVPYEMRETRTAFYHTIYSADRKFSSSRSTMAYRGRMPL